MLVFQGCIFRDISHSPPNQDEFWFFWRPCTRWGRLVGRTSWWKVVGRILCCSWSQEYVISFQEFTTLCGSIPPLSGTFMEVPFQNTDAYSGWWFGTFFIFHNIWDNPSDWLIFFRRSRRRKTCWTPCRWRSGTARQQSRTMTATGAPFGAAWEKGAGSSGAACEKGGTVSSGRPSTAASWALQLPPKQRRMPEAARAEGQERRGLVSLFQSFLDWARCYESQWQKATVLFFQGCGTCRWRAKGRFKNALCGHPQGGVAWNAAVCYWTSWRMGLLA